MSRAVANVALGGSGGPGSATYSRNAQIASRSTFLPTSEGGNFNLGANSLLNTRFNGNENTSPNFSAGGSFGNNNANVANYTFGAGDASRVAGLDLRSFRTRSPNYTTAFSPPFPAGYYSGYPYNVPYSSLNGGYYPYSTSYPYNGYAVSGAYPGIYPGACSGAYSGGYPTFPYGVYGGYSNGALFPYSNAYPFAYAGTGYPPYGPECVPYAGCQSYANPNDCRSCVSARGGSSHCADQICGPMIP